MLSRFIDRRLQRDHERAEHDQQQQRREQHHDPDEQRQLVPERRREVDRAGCDAADVHAHPGPRCDRRHHVVAQARDELARRVRLRRGARVDGDRRHVSGRADPRRGDLDDAGRGGDRGVELLHRGGARAAARRGQLARRRRAAR